MHTAALMLVCGHAPSIHCTLADIVFILQAHVFVVVFLTQTKVGHGVCIEPKIRINTEHKINIKCLTEDEYTSGLIC